MYHILPYSKKKAKELNVQIFPSRNKNKKIDIYDMNGYFITSIGSYGAMDYPTYVLYCGKEFANERRKLYKIRHKKDRNIKGSRGYYADKILW
jgi:hypothetical protein